MTTPEQPRALIVEDDPVVARSVARRLLREGYVVSLAGTCRAARAAGADFHLALLDLDLPDGSGADLADELLRHGATRQVVFYTGSLDREQRERARSFGALIDKSQSVEEVIALLEPMPTAPPISQLAPAQRPRQSGSRLSRVSVDSESVPEG
ncbi:MAG TPA: response regulator, partial [Polyangiaceae bacterium]|nr:response regulator [Polyangiaceae bacterium]